MCYIDTDVCVQVVVVLSPLCSVILLVLSPATVTLYPKKIPGEPRDYGNKDVLGRSRSLKFPSLSLLSNVLSFSFFWLTGEKLS